MSLKKNSQILILYYLIVRFMFLLDEYKCNNEYLPLTFL